LVVNDKGIKCCYPIELDWLWITNFKEKI
jgi:hypothetical protein